MFRRISIAALLLVLAGCTTYGGYYRDDYYRDYGYYDGYGYDDGYYADDGYGYGHGAYDDRYDYDYGYSSYTPFWGLDRYSCGYYGCSPYWNSYYGRPYSGWSLTFGNHWNYGSWGWYGAGWAPWYAYDYYRPHWHHPRPDRDRRGIEPKPPHPEDADARSMERRSAPGEYLRLPSRQPAGHAPAVQQRPITGPVTPMAKPNPRGAPSERREDVTGRRAPEAGVPVWRTPPRERRPESTPAPRARYQEPPAPRYREASAPRPRRYEEPSRYEQARYEQAASRPPPRQESPQPRYEQPAPRPQPRYESRPEPRIERAPARETRDSSQNDTRDDER